MDDEVKETIKGERIFIVDGESAKGRIEIDVDAGEYIELIQGYESDEKQIGALKVVTDRKSEVLGFQKFVKAENEMEPWKFGKKKII